MEMAATLSELECHLNKLIANSAVGFNEYNQVTPATKDFGVLLPQHYDGTPLGNDCDA
jgi:hypothetical protein